MQQLREKLSIAERATKTETQLKVWCDIVSFTVVSKLGTPCMLDITNDNMPLLGYILQERFQLRLKVVEDGLKSSLRSGIHYENRSSVSLSRSRSVNGADVSPNPLSSGISTRKSSAAGSRSPALPSPTSMMLKHAKGASKSFDGGRSSVDDQCRTKSCGGACKNDSSRDDIVGLSTRSTSADGEEHTNGRPTEHAEAVEDDFVSGVFYDILQKEVIALRKACHEKEQCLKDKDNSIEVCNPSLICLLARILPNPVFEINKLIIHLDALEKN